MKKRLMNNFGLKIMAVLFAFFLWLVVVNIDNPIIIKRYMVGVTVTHPEVVTNEGKSYQIVDNTSTVIVTVKATRQIVEKIRTENIQAVADLREMQGTSVPIRITIPGFEGKYEEVTANPRNIQVETEYTEKKTFPITPVTKGTVHDGYVIGEVTAEPRSIDISGPQSSVGRISKVVASVDVSQLVEDDSLKADLVYYDSANNEIDKSLLTSNCDETGVMVNVQVLDTKDVTVQFDTSEINPADNYIFSGIIVEPQTIRISGTKEQLQDIEYIAVGSEALRQEKIAENTEVVVDITKYLPEGIGLVDRDARSVVVSISIEKVGTKSISIPVRSVKVNNPPSDMELSYGAEQEVALEFQGTDDILQSMTAEKVAAFIELKDYVEEGTFEVPIQITSLPEGCRFIGGATIQITLKKK